MNQASHPSPKQHWAHLNEVSFVAGMRILFSIYRLLGPWPFRLILAPVLLWYVLTQKNARAASRTYLQRLNRQYDLQLSCTLFGILKHFASFAETILDKMLLWGGLYPLDQVQFIGRDTIHQQISEKKGGLLICSHMGNVEICRVLSRQFPEVKLTILVHTKHAEQFNRMMEKINPHSQMNLLQVTDMNPAMAMLLNEKIERGEFIVIAGDRIPVSPNPRTTTASFLGESAPFAVGPYVLASVLRCPVYFMFSLLIKDVPQVHFEKICDEVILPRKGREQVFQQLAAQYAARMEYFCQQAPYQWFNFFDFWHLPPMDISDASR